MARCPFNAVSVVVTRFRRGSVRQGMRMSLMRGHGSVSSYAQSAGALNRMEF